MLKREQKKDYPQNDVMIPKPERSFSEMSQFGPHLKLKGNISGREDILFKGEFEGNVTLENNDLTIEKTGKLKAQIRVKNIIIRGRVEGNVHASGKVLIEKDGQMTGDISAARISIQEGAQFKGSVKILKGASL